MDTQNHVREELKVIKQLTTGEISDGDLLSLGAKAGRELYSDSRDVLMMSLARRTTEDLIDHITEEVSDKCGVVVEPFNLFTPWTIGSLWWGFVEPTPITDETLTALKQLVNDLPNIPVLCDLVTVNQVLNMLLNGNQTTFENLVKDLNMNTPTALRSLIKKSDPRDVYGVIARSLHTLISDEGGSTDCLHEVIGDYENMLTANEKSSNNK